MTWQHYIVVVWLLFRAFYSTTDHFRNTLLKDIAKEDWQKGITGQRMIQALIMIMLLAWGS